MAEAPSPCTGVCRIDPASAWCAGCGRTIDEIVEWGTAGAPRRRAILAQLAARGHPADPQIAGDKGGISPSG